MLLHYYYSDMIAQYKPFVNTNIKFFKKEKSLNLIKRFSQQLQMCIVWGVYGHKHIEVFRYRNSKLNNANTL